MLTLLATIDLTQAPWIVRHWAVFVITLTLLSLGLFVALVLAKYLKLCLNIFCDTPPPLTLSSMELNRLTGQKVRFRSFDGVSLNGMHIYPDGYYDYKGTIIFCHEYGGDMYTCSRHVRHLIEAGYEIFTFDYRGHGESRNRGRYRPLQWPSDRELGDTLGAIAHVESILEAEGKPLGIGLLGLSRGAGSSILAASSTPNVKAIFLDGAFSTDRTVIALMKRWAHIFAKIKLVYENHPEAFWKFLFWMLKNFAQPKMGCRYPSVSKALSDIKSAAIYFVYGKRDCYIHDDQAKFMYETANTKKYLWQVDKARHNQAAVIKQKEYAARSTAFFDKYLAGEQVDESIITKPEKVEVA